MDRRSFPTLGPMRTRRFIAALVASVAVGAAVGASYFVAFLVLAWHTEQGFVGGLFRLLAALHVGASWLLGGNSLEASAWFIGVVVGSLAFAAILWLTRTGRPRDSHTPA